MAESPVEVGELLVAQVRRACPLHALFAARGEDGIVTTDHSPGRRPAAPDGRTDGPTDRRTDGPNDTDETAVAGWPGAGRS